MNKIITLSNLRRLLECRTVTTRITADGKEVPKKKIFEDRITLIGTDDSVCITDLKNAKSLSERRELKLVKIQDTDTKTRRPVYKLLTNAQYHEEELSKRKEKQSLKENEVLKGQKLVSLSTRIAEHDLMTGVKKILKILNKQYEVKVVVSGDNEEVSQNMERICSVIENSTKSAGKVVQLRNKGNSMRFQIIPLRGKTTKEGNTSLPHKNNEKDNDKGPL